MLADKSVVGDSANVNVDRPRFSYRVEAMLATRADPLKTGELADERAHERFPQPTGRSPRDRVGDVAMTPADFEPATPIAAKRSP